MAKAPAGKGSGELLQIAVLAGFFTAAGFALVTAFLVFFLNPKKATEAQDQANEYATLVNFLEKRDLSVLRHSARTSEGEENTKGLREIIGEQLPGYGLAFKDFPAEITKDLQSGLKQVTQKLTLDAAPMSSILQFVAAVGQAKKSIHVLTFGLRQQKRGSSRDREDSWLATVEFQDYLLGS